jgi:hypothetical protein
MSYLLSSYNQYGNQIRDLADKPPQENQQAYEAVRRQCYAILEKVGAANLPSMKKLGIVVDAAPRPGVGAAGGINRFGRRIQRGPGQQQDPVNELAQRLRNIPHRGADSTDLERIVPACRYLLGIPNGGDE